MALACCKPNTGGIAPSFNEQVRPTFSSLMSLAQQMGSECSLICRRITRLLAMQAMQESIQIIRFGGEHSLFNSTKCHIVDGGLGELLGYWGVPLDTNGSAQSQSNRCR